MSRPRRIVWPVLAVLTLLVIGGCGLLAFTTCNPPDRVEVIATHIPPGIDFVAIASATDSRQELMDWYASAALSPPFRLPAASSQSHFYSEARLHRIVWWRTGTRYGVVTRTQSGEWRVTWFPAADVPLRGRTVLGGGKADFDLSKAEIVPLDADTVKALGLQEVKPEK